MNKELLEMHFCAFAVMIRSFCHRPTHRKYVHHDVARSVKTVEYDDDDLWFFK